MRHIPAVCRHQQHSKRRTIAHSTMNTNEIKLTAESAAAYNAMFAPSAEVPTLPWDSEPKTEEELTALGIEAFGDKATKKSAICPLDFSTDFDAYNYALAHLHDENALAVAIHTDAHSATYLHSLVVNGGKLFAVWSDALEETANGCVYTTEAGAREAMTQIEEDDKEAEIYEPNYWKVIEMTRYYE